MPSILRAALGTFALALLPTASPAVAQSSGMSADIEWGLIDIGPIISPSETGRLYAPLQEKEPYQGIKVERDVKYGPDDRHALDVFVPEQTAASPRPVLMFVHGGAFVGGNKRAPGSPFYDNIMLFAARNGLVGVNVTYRLAPQHQWPSAAEDVGAAVRWVGENVARHGGDPAKIFLMGHSAGATHVAGYLALGEAHGSKGPGLAGAILISGVYDLSVMPPGKGERAYFGEDTARHAERAPLHSLAKSGVPLLAFSAELDPLYFQLQADSLKTILCRAGRCPQMGQLPKHSHMSEVYAFNTPDKSLSDQVLAFVRGL